MSVRTWSCDIGLGRGTFTLGWEADHWEPALLYQAIVRSAFQIIIPIRGQEDLDRAVELLDRTQPGRSLRIILSRLSVTDQPSKPSTDSATQAEAADSTTVAAGRDSPPPGTTPDHPPNAGFGLHLERSRRSRASTTRSEGEFIPEDLPGAMV